MRRWLEYRIENFKQLSLFGKIVFMLASPIWLPLVIITGCCMFVVGTIMDVLE